MANTYSQILVQIVFAVKGRQNLIIEEHRMRTEKYICGLIANVKSKPLAIYCNPDHCHVLIGLNPNISISEITRKIKASSSKWINENDFMTGKFEWQKGYGAFTYSRSQLNIVAGYILNQEEHHRRKSFRQEYLGLLKEFEIEYNDRFLFNFET